jgi:hypothetical protein
MCPVRTFVFWWAHQDLKLGPKDYENRQPNKTIMISMIYRTLLSVYEFLCHKLHKNYWHKLNGTTEHSYPSLDKKALG